MASTDALDRELGRLRANWPNMPITGAYREALEGVDDMTLRAGVTRLLREYESPAHPKPAAVLKACRWGAPPRRFEAPVRGAGRPDYCPQCHTPYLTDVPAEPVDVTSWPEWRRTLFTAWIHPGPMGALILHRPDRLGPAHTEDCPTWRSP